MAMVSSPELAEALKRTLYRTDYSSVGRILPACPETLSADDVEQAKAALSDLIHQRTPWDKRLYVQQEPYYKQGGTDERVTDPELQIRKVFYFVQLEPRLEKLASHPRLMHLLDQLIEPGHRLIQDMALIKPPFHGSEKPWHQDTAYFDWTPLGGVIGVWIALDPATVENGCMQVIPGTHLEGPAPHFHIRDCQLGDDRVQVDRAVVIPLKPGGVLFFSGLLHHGTPPNTSGDRRRALQFHYAAAHCRNMTFQEHAELFNEGGAYAGCRKWDPESGIPRAVYTP